MNGKKTLLLASLLITSFMFASLSVVSASNGNDGPSENAGDGISEGSNFDSPNGQNGENDLGSGHGEPAPGSGDGISEGPEW